MSIELKIILSHSLNSSQILDLPSSLNEYFMRHADQIQLRMHHGYSGELVEGDNDDWVWKSGVDPYWEQYGDRFEGEALWTWGWNPERDEPFEQWFRARQAYGSLYLRGPYCFYLSVGASTLALGTIINWHHFVFDDIVQEDVRRLAQLLTGFFGGDSVIYMPDDIAPANDVFVDWICVGRSFDQIVSWLHTLEPPRASIREMIQTEYFRTTKTWAGRGYYIDDFIGLARTSTNRPEAMARESME